MKALLYYNPGQTGLVFLSTEKEEDIVNKDGMNIGKEGYIFVADIVSGVENGEVRNIADCKLFIPEIGYLTYIGMEKFVFVK